MLAGTIERTIIAGKKTEVYLPLGQWILREGLTEVTEGDLEERMDGDVESTDIDSYVDDTIPLRCLENVAEAKRHGAQEVLVVHSHEAKDPVIVIAIEGGESYRGRWFELDMWE